MNAEIKQVNSGIEESLQGMVERGKNLSSYLNRVLLRKFYKAQLQRWQTENASQGNRWETLNPVYARYKKKRFASYPGSGTKTMIATDRLRQAATGINSSGAVKLISDKAFIVSINLDTLPYAKYPGVLRPYMRFNKKTEQEWLKGIQDYMSRGKQ